MIQKARGGSKSLDSEAWVGPLTEFLNAQAGVEAVLVDRDRQRVSLATIGEVDAKRLEEALRTALRSLDREHGRLDPARSQTFQLASSVKRLPGGTLIEKPTCPTAPQFWKWREFTWPAPEPEDDESANDGSEWKFLAILATVCGVTLIAGLLASHLPGAPDWLPRAFFAIALLAGGWDAAIDSFAKLRKRELDIHFLMLAVATGAVAIGAWWEGALLLFLFSASGAIEEFALHRTYREIRSLTAAAPKTANLLGDDGETTVRSVDTLEPGDRLRVRPDEIFPTDAEVTAGDTACDESNLTGESSPVSKAIGDTVLAGTLNLWGAVTVTVLRPARQSALQKIIDLIRNAEHLRAPSQRLTDKFGPHYTYGALGVVTVMFFVWWLGFGLPAFDNTEQTTSAFYRAMTLLVVASPCALVLSIPSAILAAIAWGATRGILYRGGGAIEALAEIDVVALDKTGTLTTGELTVATVETFPPGRDEELMEIAFTLESQSNHPIARAITKHGKKNGLQSRELTAFQSLTGNGLRGDVDQRSTYLGRRELLDREDMKQILADIPEAPLSCVEVWVLHDNLLGRILLTDEIRPESRDVLAALERHGLRTIMLTGDRRGAAEKVAKVLGVTEVRAGLQPDEKVAIIQELTTAGHRVAMVGDGVNDAPSLAAAHVSVAMGERGSDAALEQGDIILMQDRIERLLTAYRASLAARSIIRQNLAISLGTVGIMVAASLFGIVPLPVGVIAHEGSTLVVCLNSLRLLFRRD